MDDNDVCISCEYAKDTREENGKYIIYCRCHDINREIIGDELYTKPDWCPNKLIIT